MKIYLNLVKANLTLRVRNSVPDSIMLCFFITLLASTSSIPFTNIDSFALKQLMVCSMEVNGAAMRLKPRINRW